MAEAIWWVRRDLRLGDNPALLAARGAGSHVLPVFVLDDALRRPAGAPRLALLYRCLRTLSEQTDGHLAIRHGKPENMIPQLAKEIGADSVHIAEDFGPYGRLRDSRVEDALGEVALVRTGSPYAVSPGRIVKGDGEPFKVFTPFSRAWRSHGWRDPASMPRSVPWLSGVDSDDVPADPRLPSGLALPDAGEAAALARWRRFRDDHLGGYADNRNDPAADRTSRLSVYLKYGCIHPRTILADLAGARGKGADVFRTELAWREFYADVLFHRPDSAREYYDERFAQMSYDTGKSADARLAAWQDGQTGFPIVDAGMRQLLVEGWMHNRVRMIVASFLVKDLHLEWQTGARHFMRHLIDGDLPSNQHGWQWTAGCGTDAAPYFRVFNPILQGTKFDPSGDYVRRYVPELSDVDGAAAHEPWDLPAGVPAGYPERIVDHKQERAEALLRYQSIKA